MKILEILNDIPLNTSDRITLGQIDVSNIKFFKDKKLLELTLNSNSPLDFDMYNLILNKLKNILAVNVELHVLSISNKYEINNISKYVNYITTNNKKLKRIFKNILFLYNEEKNTLEFLIDKKINENDEKIYKNLYINNLNMFGFTKIEVVFKSNNFDNNFEEKVISLKETKKKSNNGLRNKTRRYKLDDYNLIQLKNVEYPEDSIKFKGEILSLNMIITKNNKKFLTMLISDKEGAIYAKIFESKQFSEEALDTIKVGQLYMFYGDIILDSFSNDLSLMIHELVLLPKESIIDDAETKRVELHLHTTMSEMDGVVDVKSVIDHVFNLGHDGVAITDHGSVQSFAKAHNQAKALLSKNKDRNFKIIYGCEMYMVNEKLTIVRNESDINLEDQTFVIFDLETTGLSSYFDKIIEFGAVKIKDHQEIDRLQLFINPEMDIPLFITHKTNITNDMVSNEPNFSMVKDQILNFIGDSVLVAHNADFDFGFLNEALKSVNEKPLKNTLIDTLDLARVLHSDRRQYRLGNIARLYKIKYDEDVAHRADYDAEKLKDIFLQMLNELRKKDVFTSKELQNLQDENAFTKNRAHHVVVLAKNQRGIKDLYELVSTSNTDSLAVFGKGGEEFLSEPRIIKETLDNKRENILIGSACLNGEVFEYASNKDQESLEEIMGFYDYIEIQPLDNYSNLISNNAIRDKKRLQEIILRIINTAVKLNKIIVATGDVHYLNPDQKKFRDVYINSQGVGGVRHPLYIYNKDIRRNTKNPDQHFRTTNEMLESFKWLNDEKLAYMLVVNNSRIIFNMIEEVLPVPKGTYPPIVEGSAQKLKDVCYANAHLKYGENLPEIVVNRLEKELDSIISNGYAVVYYISHLLVKKSNDDGYIVGSRGSVGSSFVATMSKITEVNPLFPHYVCENCHHSEFFIDGEISSGYDLEDKPCPVCNTIMKGDGHNIPFETFLGFEGEKVPDIDLNFSNEYQAKAHNFTKEVFGDDHVYRAGTIGTVADKTAFGYVSGYLEEMGLDHVSKAYKDYLALGCVGIKRTTGQHPGGIIVIPQDMETSDFTPIQFPANDKNSEWKTTHFDFHDIHDNVLKFDILGHIDPTAMRLLYNISGIDPTLIPMNDPRVISLFYSSDELHADSRIYDEKTGALGLPEFGTKITRKVLEEALPKNFSELVIISGLTHGTDVWANNAQTLIQQGLPLDEVIGCRDDIMTFLISKGLKPISAFAIMESVRKGKGLKPEWEELMKENNVPDWYIDSCKKIKYMFPKAHACAYVIMALRIAWFKVYYPQYFYVQYFTLRSDAYEIETMSKGIVAIKERMNDIFNRMNTYGDKRASNKERALYDSLEICNELYARGYKISNIDLYKSKATEFSVDENDPKTIIPSFITIDGLGVNVAKSIEIARKEREFISKEDLIKRTQLSNKLVEKLDKLGCLEGLSDMNQMSLFG
ncbi:MAG: PolC-type DNA polymerase III [Erysipelotrichaceae bacterium]|nr:PolC-type DNA polymerase III [Erysipelotrichaceae bacterium]